MDSSNIHISKGTLKVWQSLLNLAAYKSDIPAALIMRIDETEIKVFLSSESKGNPYKAGDSECLLGSGLYCERVIKSKYRLLVPNALKDKEWDKNPDIKLGMISYLGFPILWPNKEVFGTICMLDSKENSYVGEHGKILLKFKEYIEGYLDWTWSKYLHRDPEEIAQKETHCEKLLSRIEKIISIAR